VYLGFFDKHGLTYIYFFSAHCKHVQCNTLTHFNNEDLLNIKRTSDITETRNPCVIKVILFACFTYIDIFKFYWISSDILTRKKNSAWKLTRIILCPLSALSLDPKKKSSPINLGPKNLDTILMHWMSVKLADNFPIRKHSWPCLFHITGDNCLDIKKLTTSITLQCIN
jgi:hypothetical protein